MNYTARFNCCKGLSARICTPTIAAPTSTGQLTCAISGVCWSTYLLYLVTSLFSLRIVKWVQRWDDYRWCGDDGETMSFRGRFNMSVGVNSVIGINFVPGRCSPWDVIQGDILPWQSLGNPPPPPPPGHVERISQDCTEDLCRETYHNIRILSRKD